MRKRLFAFAAVVLLTLSSAWAQQVKYVFYFIGDGMGVNQINVTETYLAALKGKIGFEPITMSSFPVVGMVNTYSATNGVTDSAAGGTALASGKKTKKTPAKNKRKDTEKSIQKQEWEDWEKEHSDNKES